MNLSCLRKQNKKKQNPTESVYNMYLHKAGTREKRRTAKRGGKVTESSCTSAGGGAFSLGLVTTLALLFICGCAENRKRRLRALVANSTRGTSTGGADTERKSTAKNRGARRRPAAPSGSWGRLQRGPRRLGLAWVCCPHSLRGPPSSVPPARREEPVPAFTLSWRLSSPLTVFLGGPHPFV